MDALDNDIPTLQLRNPFINNNISVYSVIHSILYILIISCCFAYDYKAFSIDNLTHQLFIKIT